MRSFNIISGVPSTTIKYGPYSSCYWVTIPVGYTPGYPTSFTDELDYAVIDFSPCSLTPGSTVGWYAPAIGASSDFPTAASQLWAYDSASPPPNSGSTFYTVPSLITRAKPAWSVSVSPSSSSILAHILDTTPGSSGGGLIQQVFSNVGDWSWYVVGANVSEDPPPATSNYARRLDNTFFSFIQANSGEY